MLYHLSTKPNIKRLMPKIPSCAISGHENITLKRICFSDSIERCLSALQDIPRKYYVYTPIEENLVTYTPTVDEVRDGEIHHEVWRFNPTQVKCIGVIQSENYTKATKHNSGRGRVWYFYYPYKWIKKNLV